MAGPDEEYSRDFLLGWERPLNLFDGSAEADEEYSKDLMLAYRSIAESQESNPCTLGYKALPLPEAKKFCLAHALPVPEAKPVVDAYDISARRAMDELLRNCFLQAAKTNQITRQLRLGMPSKGSRIYAECMRPCRPLGTSIDVKLSSFSCLKNLFEDLEARGLIELKYSAHDPVVSKFFWDHPDILNFELWPLATTVLGASEESSAPGPLVEATSSVSQHHWFGGKPAPASRKDTSRSISSLKGQGRTEVSGEELAKARDLVMSRDKVSGGTGSPDGLKENGSITSSTLDAIQRVPSPSKARARRQR